MKKVKPVWIYIVGVITIFIIWFKILPVLHFFYWGLPILICLYGLIVIGLKKIFYQENSIMGTVIFGIGLILITIVPFFLSSSIFYATQYRNLIGDISSSSFSQDINQIDIDHIRLVDEEMAQTLGDKRLGEDPALGSQAMLGRFNIQKVNGELYWVAPLLHRNIWKWLDNRQGTPGYVMVSATNPQGVKLVQTVEEKPIFIKYQPKGYFGEYLKRYVYLHGYATKGITDFTFEIDEQGRPFWVITLFEKRIGYGGNDATGVVVVDAQSGSISQYDIAHTPNWIDRIQPEEFIASQLESWGRYVKGWWNSILAEEQVLQISSNTLSLVYGNDKNSYWYSGLTSSGNDQSTVGFVLVNTRTKETKFYKQAGATEEAAMNSAEGKVQEKGYIASYPIMYNVLGRPTYVTSLKDKAGLVKLVGMISVEDFSTLGIGETKADALREYRNALREKGNEIPINSNIVQKEHQGTVLRINEDIKNGTTYYYLLVEGQEKKVFIATSDVSEELPLTNIGDVVRVQYEDINESIVEILDFDNMSLLIH